MDIVEAFTSNDLSVNITIKCEKGELLFRASDVADALGFKNYRIITRKLRENLDKVYISHETPGGTQALIFLTERGLYELLFRSSSNLAIVFKDWVVEIIRKERERYVSELQHENRTLRDQVSDLQTAVNVTSAIYIWNKDVRNTDEKVLLKIGFTELNPNQRAKPFKQTDSHGRMELVVPFPHDKKLLQRTESMTHTVLGQYQEGNEVFRVNLEEAKLWVLCISNIVKSSLMPKERANDLHQLLIETVQQFSSLIDGSQIKIKATQSIATQTTCIFDPDNPDNRAYEDSELNAKFKQFIQECCTVSPSAETSSEDIIGRYRIWAKEAKKETFHAMQEYLKTFFTPCRLQIQNQNHTVYGFRGVSVNPYDYRTTSEGTDIELFISANCSFVPSGKTLIKDLVYEYQEWKKRMSKPLLDRDVNLLRAYLKNHPLVLYATLWTHNGNGQGFYGIMLNSEVKIKRKTSSTAKAVEKRHAKTHELIDTFTTIAKAAFAAHIAPCKMSRWVKSQEVVDGFYYKQASHVL